MAVSGIPILKKEFDISLHYFDFTSCSNDADRDRIEGELNDWIKERIPNGADPNLNIFT